jgi:hypothetical protein
MGDYFIPLKTILPSAARLADLLPVGESLNEALEKCGIHEYREAWNDTDVAIEGEVVVDDELSIPVGGFAIVLGVPAGGLTSYTFQFAMRRRSALKAAIDAGIKELVGTASTEEDAEVDPTTQMFLQMDAFPSTFRITLSGSVASLRLPIDHAKLGETVMIGDDVVGIKRVVPEKPVDIALPAFTLSYDSVTGFNLVIPENAVLNSPPFLIGDSELGILAKSIKVDVSSTGGFAEVLARPGFDESWKGVYLGELGLFGLDKMLPFLPAGIDATNWICGTEGWSGGVDVIMAPSADPNTIWQVGKIGIEFDRGALVRGTIGVILKVGEIHEDLASLGPGGNLEILLTLRHNPELKGAEAWGFEIALLTPNTKDQGLITFNETAINTMEFTLPLLALMLIGASGNVTAASSLVVLLFNILSVLQQAKEVVMKRLTIDALRIRYFTQTVSGEPVRFVDFSFDFQTKLMLDIEIPLIVTLTTTRPIGVYIKGLILRWVPGFDQKSQAVRDQLGSAFKPLLEPVGGVSFDLSDQALVQWGGFIEIVEFGIGKWEKGLWFDIGVRSTKNLSSVAGGSGAVRLFYLANGDFDHVALKGIGFTLVVPEVIYCKAELGWGEVKQVHTRAHLVGNGGASLQKVDPKDPMGKLRAYMNRDNYFFDTEVLLEWTDLPSGDTALIAGVDFSLSAGIPIGSTDVAIFGLLGQYANDFAPNPPEGDWRKWFMDLPTQNSVLGLTKWKGSPGDWGVGFGTVIGSLHDLGRTWNAKVGLTILSGPVLVIYGAANILTERPKIGDTEGAKFVALIVLDVEHDTITIGITVQDDIPSGGKILSLQIPGEIFVRYGESDPAKALGILDISGYLMIDTETITNLAGSGEDIPSFAIALGGRGEWQKGLKSGKLKCYFYVFVEFDLGVGLPEPWLVFGMARIEGGLVIKVFGFGFHFSVYAQIEGMAPEPYYLKGKLGISIDLPWPLPDFDRSIPITLVDEGGSLPPPGSAASGLSIHPSNANQPITIAANGVADREIPIDATMTLAFRFPVQNEVAAIGSINLDSVDMSTTFVTAPPHGYSFSLADLTLKNLTTGAQVAGIPARWRQQSTPDPGGQKARTVLELFSFKSDITSRYVGPAATYMDSATKGWNPCRSVDVGQVCYGFAGEPLGAILTRSLSNENHPTVTISIKARPPNSDFLLGAFQLAVSNAEIVEISWNPSAPPLRVAAVPATYGQFSQLFTVSDVLAIEFARARDIWMMCLRRTSKFETTAKFYDGDQLIGTSQGVPGISLFDWEQLLFLHAGPATRVELTTHWKNNVFVDGLWSPPDSSVFLGLICMKYESEAIEQAEAAASQDAWSKLWSDLLSQNAATSDALLLDPECTYELSGLLHWQHVKDSGGGDETFTYRFDTEKKSRLPQPLRKRDHNLAAADDRWEIDAVPSDGTFAMYTTRPLRLIFSDARVPAVFAKFDQQLTLRLIDDHGVDLFHALKTLAAEAPTLPEYQQVWKSKVVSASCTPPGAASLWDFGIAVFPSILARNREYKAELYALPNTISDFASTDWSQHPIVYDFKFRTSRWQNLTEHAATHGQYEEIVDNPDFQAIHAIIGTSLEVYDDQKLDQTLFDHIGLPFRRPANDPEVILIWRKSGVSFAAVGLLLDGPEPILRSEASSIALTLDGAPVDFRIIGGQSKTRLLLVFASGGQFNPIASGSLSIAITDAFTDNNGAAATEVATIPLAVPDAPAVVAPEAVP